MQRIGLKLDSVTLVAVLNACSNIGKLELGKWVHAYIDKNRIKADGFIGNVLIDMYEMPIVGIKLDAVTFVGVFSACSHAGLVKEGQKHFEDMSKVYNLKPQTEHYGCMVDLLDSAGLLSEAEEFIANMPIEPGAFVWVALLGVCSIHGKVELGKSVMENLVAIEPIRDGVYVLVSNI
ncbi:hypothetical protein PTKIN_Ptkin03bG0106300 [Pterospermum kingtungense]